MPVRVSVDYCVILWLDKVAICRSINRLYSFPYLFIGPETSAFTVNRNVNRLRVSYRYLCSCRHRQAQNDCANDEQIHFRCH